LILDSTIRAFRTLAACCSLSYLNKYRKSAMYGEDDCHDKNLWILMLWAKGVMSRTPLLGETDGLTTIVSGAGTAAANGYYTVDPDGVANLDLPALYKNNIDTTVGVWRNATGFGQGTAIVRNLDGYWFILDASQAGPLVTSYYEDTSTDEHHPHNLPGEDQVWIVSDAGAEPVPAVVTVGGSCVDREFTEKVLDKAKCYCDICGCHPVTTPTPVDCTIVPDFTVDTVIDAAQVASTEANNQVDGYAYYIVSIVGGSGSTPGTMATYSTTLGGWQYTNPAAGSIILDSSSNVLWVDYVFPVLPAMLFPPIDVNSDESGLYVLQSRFPQQATGSSRTAIVEMSTDNTTWVEIYNGLESALAIPTNVTVSETGYFFVRVTYIDGPCTYQYYDGNVTLVPNPPGSSRSWFFPSGFSVATGGDFVDCINNQQSTVSFRFKIQEDTDSVWMESINGGWALSIGAGGGFPFAGVGPTVFCYLQIDVYGGFTYVGDTAITTNSWHVVEFVRDASVVDGWAPGTDFNMYLDGVLQTMSPVGAIVPPSYIAGSIPTQPLQPLLWSDNTSGAWIDEVYGCRTARSQSDITTVIEPNLMQGSDATWDRAFYWRIEDTDNDLLVANQPSGVPFIGTNTTLSTDVDPTI